MTNLDLPVLFSLNYWTQTQSVNSKNRVFSYSSSSPHRMKTRKDKTNLEGDGEINELR